METEIEAGSDWPLNLSAHWDILGKLQSLYMYGCFIMNCKLGFYLYMVVVLQAKGLFARRDQ